MRVLIIDDDVKAAQLTLEMLYTEIDIEARCLHSAEECLHHCNEFKPDLVLLDLRMPTVDGVEVIHTLRMAEQSSRLPILLLSAHVDPIQKVKGFQAGANDYIVKWPARAELIARIRSHAESYRLRLERDAAYASLQKSQQLLIERTEELDHSKAALQQAQKLEAIGQLTGGIAHDFNNLLQVISGNLQLIRPSIEADPKVLQRLEVACGAVDRGATVVSHLLAFARRQPLRPMTIDLQSVLWQMHGMLRPFLPSNIALEILIADDLWNVLIDPHQFENAVLNLILNARDALSADGKVSLCASNVLLEASHLPMLSDLSPGEYIRVEVSDDGCGISPMHLERIMEPFFTTKETGRGSGLGLSMVYGFAKQSGGTLLVTSEMNQGTSVSIYLPRDTHPVERPVHPIIDKVVFGTERILVVEDDEALRGTVVATLRDLGYQVAHAPDAATALGLLQAGLQVDLIFTDVMMPGELSATELVECSRSYCPGAGALYTSGYSENILGPDAVVGRNVQLLKKPYRREQLATAVRLALDDTKTKNLRGQAPVAESPVTASLTPSRVLIVDDNSDLLEMTLFTLQELGHDVIGAGSAEEAIDLMAAGFIRVLVTDINLPGMSGVELARVFKRKYPATKVIFISGMDVPQIEGLDANILPKPFRLSDLSSMIRTIALEGVSLHSMSDGIRPK